MEFHTFRLQGFIGEQVSLGDFSMLFPKRADEVKAVHEKYLQVDKLRQDPRKNAKKISTKLRSILEEDLAEFDRDTDAPEADEHIDCYCMLLYDYKVKVKVAKQQLEEAAAESQSIEILHGISEKTYRAYMYFEARDGLIGLACTRGMMKLGRLPEPELETQKDAGGASTHYVCEMKKRRSILEKEVEPAKKAEFLLNDVKPIYQGIMEKTKELHEIEEKGETKLEALSSEYRELMDGTALRQVAVLYIKALRIVSNEVLSINEPRMPSALNILLGADWRHQTHAERSSRLRALSTLFHPDKVNWFERDILEEADIDDPEKQISQVQKVINEAIAYMKTYFETVEWGEKNCAMASEKWKEALEKNELEDQARKENNQPRAQSLKNQKEKDALEALDLWRASLRIFTEGRSAGGELLIELRTNMAQACDLLNMKLECQVYLLSAMRVTAKAVAECRFTDTTELEKYRAQWVAQRKLLEQLKDRATPQPAVQQGSNKVADTASQGWGLSIAKETVDAMLLNDLNTDGDLNEIMKATSSFDIKNGLVLGAAVENLTVGSLSRQRALIDTEMSEIANKSAVAVWRLGKYTAGGVAASGLAVAATTGVVGAIAHASVGVVVVGAMAVSLPLAAGFGLAAGLTAGAFWIAGRLFGWRGSKAFEQEYDVTSHRNLRRKAVIEFMEGADNKRLSGKPDAGFEFLKALSADLSECKEAKDFEKEAKDRGLKSWTPLFENKTKILKYPSSKFAIEGELVADVEESIRFLTEDVEVCAAGVLQYFVNVAEVLAGRQVTSICEGVSINQEQSLTGAKKLMYILLKECGGVDKEKEHKGAQLHLAPNPEGALLKKAQKEDEADHQSQLLGEMLADGVVDIEPGTKPEDVGVLFTDGWFGVYIAKLPTELPNCNTIKAKDLFVDMVVRSVKVIAGNGVETKLTKISRVEILQHVARQDYKHIQIVAERGARTQISNFAKACFCSSPSKEKGVKEKEVIKLREIIKINLAMVFLISTPVAQKGSDKSMQEIMSEWLLQEVISTIEREKFSDSKLLERVEALKDFFFVFVGLPLALDDTKP